MCVAALSAIVGIAQSFAQFGAEQAQYSAEKAQFQQNYVNALAAGRDQHQQIELRQLQEQQKFGQEQHLSLVEEAEKRADATVQSEAQGVSGLSVGNLLADISRKAAYNRGVNEENYMMTAAQLTTENNAVVDREENQINSVQQPVAPSPLGPILGAVGAGVKAFGSDIRIAA